MRVVITDATAPLGRQLVPLLIFQGVDVALVGQDLALLAAQFPTLPAVDYSQLATVAIGADMLVHLPSISSAQAVDGDMLKVVNVERPLQLAREATSLKVSSFVYITSVHTLDPRNTTPYAVSKREAAAQLAGVAGINLWTLYLPAIVGDELSGKLALVDRLPGFLRARALKALGALKPTLHIHKLAQTLTSLPKQAEDAPRHQIVSDGQQDNCVFRFIKRVIDIGFALGIIVCLWWAMIGIWLAIRITTKGPGMFLQERVGRNAEVFTCYKFRTMNVSAPNVGTHEIAESAVTPIGKFLRRTKLDELPQVLNILRNEMSLVGPRPCLPTQYEMVAARQREGVFAVKPGITGLAQVRGVDMSVPTTLAKCDREYIELQSLLLDLKIMLQTARGAGSGDQVRKSTQ
jgi:lipopolysaccharide/colanic/teichoic acid biosynthesis glycosyltransferase